MEPLEGNGTVEFTEIDGNSPKKSFTIPNTTSVMHRNGIFSTGEDDWYNSVNRFSWVDLRNHIQYNREYLFFTKPDLYLMEGSNLQDAYLNDSLKHSPFFVDAFQNHKEVLGQLQYSINDRNGRATPFMFLLTNSVSSKLDLPGITAESHESTTNIYGTSISYRTHSLKSDNGYDFTLSFNDTKNLEVYTLAKAYDEYIRMSKTGQINILNGAPKAEIHKDYVINRVLPEQFSIYKFLIADDGETIAYYAKATGCYFTDVPRAEFGDPQDGVVKFSLSFHANFIEDNNPLILSEFNNITLASNEVDIPYSDIWTADGINNEWVVFPCIRAYSDIRATSKAMYKDYRLKWTNKPKAGVNLVGSSDNGGSRFYGPYSYPGGGILSDLMGGYTPQSDFQAPRRQIIPTIVDTVRSSVDTIGNGLDWVRNQVGDVVSNVSDIVSSAQSNLEDNFRTLSLRIQPDGQTVTFGNILDYAADTAQGIYNNLFNRNNNQQSQNP